MENYFLIRTGFVVKNKVLCIIVAAVLVGVIAITGIGFAFFGGSGPKSKIADFFEACEDRDREEADLLFGSYLKDAYIKYIMKEYDLKDEEEAEDELLDRINTNFKNYIFVLQNKR